MDTSRISDLGASDLEADCAESAVIRLTDGSLIVVRADQSVFSIESNGNVHRLPEHLQ